MLYKWLLDCVIWLFADPIANENQDSVNSSQAKNEVEDYSLEDCVRACYGNDIEQQGLDAGVTIANSAEPNYGCKNLGIKTKTLFEDVRLSEDRKAEPVVTAKKLSIWSFICLCCYDDPVVVESAGVENQSQKNVIWADLIGESHNNDIPEVSVSN